MFICIWVLSAFYIWVLYAFSGIWVIGFLWVLFYLRVSELCHLEVDRLFLRLGWLLSCLGHPLGLGCGIHASPHETGHLGDLCGLDHGEPAGLLCERCGDAVPNAGTGRRTRRVL